MNLFSWISYYLHSGNINEKWIGVAFVFAAILAFFLLFVVVYLTTKYVVELVKSRKVKVVEPKNKEQKVKLTKEQRKQIKTAKKVEQLKSMLKKFGVSI